MPPPKGTVPWNKGKKVRLNPGGEFKKGSPPAPHKDGCKCFRCAPYEAKVWKKVKKGKDAHRWNGGKRIGKNGYYYIYVSSKVYVLEHRYIMESFLKRKLEKNEHIHHINQDKLDNRLENLLLLSASEHSRLHNNLKIARH